MCVCGRAHGDAVLYQDINDPAHPDYWANLKKTLDGDDANPQSDSKQLVSSAHTHSDTRTRTRTYSDTLTHIQ